jgi:hypothetical protein
VQHIDAFTYAHLERLPPQPTLDDQLAEGPDASADWWERISEARIRVVVETSPAAISRMFRRWWKDRS